VVEILGVRALADNYIWLIHEPEGGETVVVDPAIAEPVLAACDERGWGITQIWNTHWHPDHTDGNVDIKAATGCRVVGPLDDRHAIPALDEIVDEGSYATIGRLKATVMSTPGHTHVHVVYHLPAVPAIFTGDTLFALGCGRLLEGTAEQMFTNMQRFAALPDETRVYCAHEYTQSNGKFALTVDANNSDLIERMVVVDAARAAGLATVPSTIGEERATNPFMRVGNSAALAARREAKDRYRG
jgi:hydroxyacylglutathione hydrolase